MRKWAIGIVLAAIVSAAAVVVLLIMEQRDHQIAQRYVRNEGLPTIMPDWPGNAIDQKGRFMDVRNSFLPNTLELLKWRLGDNPLDETKKNDTWSVQVVDPNVFLRSGRPGIQWLGHASFHIRSGETAILTDPIFNEPAFLPRFVPVHSQLSELADVDLVLLSHDHRDHMDEMSLRAIAAKFPDASFLAGLRSDDLLSKWITPSNAILTAGWFQEYKLSSGLAEDGVRVYFHPVRHWSRRGLFDTNHRLWGSFLIEIGGKIIYFGGDSGFADHYREAGELFPKIDYFVIGIGAYEPRWFMEPNHNTPQEALRAFQESGADTMIPMHYGTFDLSDEPVGQPLSILIDEAEKAGIMSRIKPLAINESIDW